MTLDLENSVKEEEYKNILINLSKDDRINEYMPVRNFNVIASKDNIEKEAKVFVPNNPENIGDFIQLRQRRGGQGTKSTNFSYLWAALFTGIVNMGMYYKLKNIHMVESLKSLD
ncbi:hypothetical protein [Clostridium sp. UBA1056]|uniref:hypothetical protein n=1 Tax=unclassified Clostridium TaxID=2614128 RepID=UPI003216DE49